MKKLGIGITSGLVGVAMGGLAVGKTTKKILEGKKQNVDKFKSYYNVLNQWLLIKREGRNLSKYFQERKYNRIAIYGLGELGKHLIDELESSEVEIVYGIDKNIDNVFNDLTVYSIEELSNVEQVDAVVVTPVFAFDSICEKLDEMMQCPIISLEDVVFEM